MLNGRNKNPIARRTPLKRKTPLKRSGAAIARNARPKKKADKRIEEEKLYGIARLEYLKENPICQGVVDGVRHEGCTMASAQIHHKKGKIGKLLYDKRFFLALCDDIEFHRKIEVNPDWAKSKGLSISKLAK